jgi:5-methylcytosine-specific restriction protein A
MRRREEVKVALKIILKEPDVNCNTHEQEKDYEFQRGVEQMQVVAETIIDKPKKIPELKDKTTSEAWARNPIIAWNALNAANYLCEISHNHKTFASNISGKNYVEAHHLIPMSYQSSFAHSLDVECNINSLCPNCHKLIHLAVLDEKKQLIATLYELRKDRLAKAGLRIDLDTMLKMYSQ